MKPAHTWHGQVAALAAVVGIVGALSGPGAAPAQAVTPTITAGAATPTVTAIAAGGSHTCALLADHSVRCWGNNDSGQVGDGTTTERPTPVAVPGIRTATAISTGGSATCALLADGTVRCWGSNEVGQLGDGTSCDPSNQDCPLVPVAVSGIKTAIAIAAGDRYACALLADHTLRCWGGSWVGQLGDGRITHKTCYSMDLDAVDCSPTPVAVSGITTATAISAGDGHACALLADRSVRCWGRSDAGELGDGNPTRETCSTPWAGDFGCSRTPVAVSGIATATAISAGGAHTCALVARGKVRCWGDNTYGQLGDGTFTHETCWYGGGYVHDCSLTPVAVSGIAAATAISAGGGHTCALLADHTVRCWGSNERGKLGDGVPTHQTCGEDPTSFDCSPRPVAVSGIATATEVAAGDGHTCARLADLAVRCWGSNYDGQLGDGTSRNWPAPVRVSGMTTATAIAAGGYDTCTRVADGTVRCWGANWSGQLGDGTTTTRPTPVVVPGITTATAIAVGRDHSCAVLADHTIRCWGSNVAGWLGDGTTCDAGYEDCSRLPVAVSGITSASAVAAGSEHTCALLADGTVRCWGANWAGQLGDGRRAHQTCPYGDFDQADCSPTPVAVSGITTATAISAGDFHTCALIADGTTRCWGGNWAGELGDGAVTHETCWGYWEEAESFDCSPTPVAVSGITTTAAIAAGGTHSCALLADGTVRCWGSNGSGQLGDGTTSGRHTLVAVAGITSATAISAGGSHTCARLADGTARCWGANEYGQLGDGTWAHRNCGSARNELDCSPTPVAVSGLTTATAVSAGFEHTCAVLADRTARCWGSGESGQLGDPTASYRLKPVAVVFDTTAPTTGVPLAGLRAGRTLIGSAVQIRLGWTGTDGGGTGIARYVVALSRNGTPWRTVLTARPSPYAYRTVPTSGTVRYRVRAIDRAANAGRWVTGPTLAARLVQQSGALVHYTGTWRTARSAAYSGGTTRYATTAGASATYTFSGRSVALVTSTGPTRGRLKVYVDGRLAATLDLHAAVPRHRVLAWARTWATPGRHTVRLVVAGTSGHPRVDLDAFAVLR